MTDWVVERHRGAAAALHERPAPDPLRRTVWIMEPTRPALVLGSTQDADTLDDAAVQRRGLDVLRRRSGGGAVLLAPGRVAWIDVWVPAGDPLWDDDVGRSFYWVGDAWVAALAEVGIEVETHRGALVRTQWSDQVCFSGLGPGEVTTDGRKVVGLSQRRTRDGARIQSLVLAEWDPAPLAELLGLELTDLTTALGAVATGVGARNLGAVTDAFVVNLRHSFPEIPRKS